MSAVIAMHPATVLPRDPDPCQMLWAGVLGQAVHDATNPPQRMPRELNKDFAERERNHRDARAFLYSTTCRRLVLAIGLEWEGFEAMRDAAMEGAR